MEYKFEIKVNHYGKVIELVILRENDNNDSVFLESQKEIKAVIDTLESYLLE